MDLDFFREQEMDRMARLQFQRLTPEAQRAALWRLAWSGLSVEQIAERSGWPVERVRAMIDEESMQVHPAWSAQIHSAAPALRAAS